METMSSVKVGITRIQTPPLPVEIELLRSDNPLLDEMAARSNWTAEEKFQQGEQMKDESEMATIAIDGKLEGWPSEVPPNCPVCKECLRLDETCAACDWGVIPFLNGASTVNLAEADCGT